MSTLRIFNVSEYVYAGSYSEENPYAKRVPKYFGGVVEHVDGRWSAKTLPTGGFAFIFNTLFEYLGRKFVKKEDETIVYCIDKPPTVKQQLYRDIFEGVDGYKSHRPKKKISTKIQLDFIEDLLKAHTPNVYSYPGYEADDIIATIVRDYEDSFDKIIVHTRDSDLFCLVSDKTEIQPVGTRGHYVTKDNYINEVKTRNGDGIRYNGILMYKMFTGDKSDNIPSVDNKIKNMLATIPSNCYERFNDLDYQRAMIDKYTMFDIKTVKLFDLIAPTLLPVTFELYDEYIDPVKVNATGRIIGNGYARDDVPASTEVDSKVKSILDEATERYTLLKMEEEYYG